MRFDLKALVLAVALPLAAVGTTAAPAQATAVDLIGGVDFVLPGPAPNRPASAFEMPSLAGILGVGDTVRLGATFSLNTLADLTFTYIGSEATFHNFFNVGGERIFYNYDSVNAARTVLFDPGVPDFGFSTIHNGQLTAVNNGDHRTVFHTAMAFFQATPTTFYALYNDRWLGDIDFDDMVVRIDVAPIPLPPAVAMLLAALGGLAFWRRRRAAAPAQAG